MFATWKKNINRKRLKDEKFDFLFDSYAGDELVVFDTETTGLNPKVDELLSIGAVIIKENKILSSETFEIFIKPTEAISQESIKIHHLRECDFETAVSALEGVEKFLHFIGSRPLVGYYLEFDVAMIERYVKPWLGIKLPNKQIEVSALYFDKKISLIPQGNIDLRFDTILQDLKLPTWDSTMPSMMPS